MQPQQQTLVILPLIWKQTQGEAPEPPFSMYLSPKLLPHLHGAHGFLELVLVVLCLVPCPVQAAWFRVGVVGPWGCDPLFAKALPSVAAQLAVNRINRDPLLSYAATFDYIVLQVGC